MSIDGLPIVLKISERTFVESLSEATQKLVIIKEISKIEYALRQLISVLFYAEMMLAERLYCTVGLVDGVFDG